MADKVITGDDIVNAAKDSLYVTVGLGVMAFQRAQVRRQEAGKVLDDNVKMVEERVAAIEERLDEVLDDVQEKLPTPARDAMEQARTAAKEARSQLRSLLPTESLRVMRIAVDATPLLHEPTGVGTMTSALLRGLAAEPGMTPVAFALSWRRRGRLHEAVPDGVEIVDRPLPARPLREAWLRSNLPRLDHLIGRHDLVHGPNFVVPPSKAPQLATVHDLTPVRFPELCSADTLQFPDLIRRAIGRGAWIHTVSEFVRAEVMQHFAVDPARVVTVPNTFSPADRGDASSGRRLADADRYVLALGTLEPRKDFPTLVSAFDRLAETRTDLDLVLAGADGWGADAVARAIRDSRHQARIHRLGYVTDSQRADLLAGAAVFAYPSLYEGFGLPPLEAMSVGTPVVTTDAGGLLEVAGDGALQVGVGDADALAEAIGRVLDDSDLADRLVAGGHRTVARYTPERMIDGMVALYREIAAAA